MNLISTAKRHDTISAFYFISYHFIINLKAAYLIPDVKRWEI